METIFRVHHDSSHFVGVKYLKKAYSDDIFSLKSYESEFCKEHKKFKCSKKKVDDTSNDPFEDLMNKAYLKSLEYGKKHRLSIIQQYLKENNFIISDEAIKKFLENKYKNLKNRIDRFRKKALLNKWNYFVTITYDDEKHTEETFVKSLKKCLANLHDNNRGGYRYMGVFERGAEGRLHFHALFNIPHGEMKGEIIEKRIYSYKTKGMRLVCENSWFLERFGTNDFIKIDTMKLMKDNTINYLLKYIEKSEEPIFYSRDIPTYLYLDITEDNIISCFGELVKKYVLFDDVLESCNSLPMRC